MNIQEKSEIVSQIKELVTNSTAIYLVDYKGVNVEDVNRLRAEFRKEGVTYKVFKNTLFKKAIQDIPGYEKLNDLLVGMIGIAFTGDNAMAPAKIIKKYHDASQKLSLRGCYIESAFFEGDKLDAIAALPTKPEIIAGILGSLNAPASGIVGAISGVMRELVSVIDEIAKKKAA